MVSDIWKAVVAYFLVWIYTLQLILKLPLSFSRESNIRTDSKSVSICSDPPTENGPCSRKEEEEELQGDEDGTSADRELQAVASKLVDDVVKLAEQTADERAASLEREANSLREELRLVLTQNHQELRPSPERLPSILIDTVPSMPPSPTEWPPPPPEATILEEDETLEEEEDICLNSQEETGLPEEIQTYATNYIHQLLSNAMELAEEKQKTQDEAMIREVAVKVIDDVIARASESAVERLTTGLSFPANLPSIQIDTVVSMPPSPTEEEESLQGAEPPDSRGGGTTRPHQIPEITYMQYEESEEPKTTEIISKLVKYSEAPEEVQEFAATYVKDVISKAVTLAEEKIVTAVPFSFEDGDMLKVNGPWYIRMREALMRVLRSACFCTPRRDDS